MQKNNIETALDLVGKALPVLKGAKSDSLIEYAKPTRVEPIVLMDEKVINLPFMPDTMQALTSIFGGYYLQAVSLMVNVGSVNVIGLLDSVNPDRDPLAAPGSGYGKLFVSKESYRYGLPVAGEKVGLEHFGLENEPEAIGVEAIGLADNKDNLQTLRTPSTLAVGKMLEVHIESEGQQAKFPVSLRLIPVVGQSGDIVHTLSVGSKDKSFMGRIHAWRSGQIEFVKDLILCQDLISDHKKGLIKDDAGIYSQSMKRKQKGILSTILSGNPSVAVASNIIVLSASTAKELEKEIRGRLKDFRTREKLFKETYTMLLVVIDPDWEAITVYHRSIETPSDLTAADVKNMAKKEVDVGEILKAYQLGNSPSF